MAKKRVPKQNKTKVDVTKPVDISQFDLAADPDDCFGKEWDMGTTDCSICHDNEVCGILFAAGLKKRVAKIEKKTTFLDKTYFSDKLEKQLDNALKDRGKVDIQDVYDAVSTKAKTNDKVAIREWVKRFADSNGYLINADEIWKAAKNVK